jgi:glycosyltransferase involved in cell wall biosynthesis
MLQRAVAVCVLILRCARKPSLARFLPPAAVAELLAPSASSGGSRFEAILAAAVGCGPEEMHRLFETITDHLAAHGLALANPAIAPRTVGTAPARARDKRIESGLEPGIAVIGPAEITSGLGQATRQSIAALTAVGRNPAVLNYRRPFPSRVQDTGAVRSPALETPRRINLIHLNADLLPMARVEIDDRVFARSYNIGYFFWELDQVPEAHRLAFDLVDEVWVASEYNREIFARGCEVPVHNVGLAVEALPASIPGTRRDYGLPEDGFVFLATFDAFSYVERKNPLGLVHAFRDAFPPGQAPNVHLAIKTQNKTGVFDPHAIRLWQQIDALVQDDPRIRVIDQTLSYVDLLGLKKACDAYVSLHRSEGLGIGMIEAMQLGRPVIATNYSGNLEFCTPETAFLVDATLVPVAPGQYVGVEPGSRWAEPSLASAAAQMRRVYEDAAEVRTRVAAASRLATEAFSLAAIGRRYEARLQAIEAQWETATAR